MFFSVNHRWSMAAALIAMLAGFFAVLLTTNHITMVQKSLLKISYLVIFCFLGLIVFFFGITDLRFVTLTTILDY